MELPLLWARTAAEHRATYLQTYSLAADRIRDAIPKSKRWGVVLDVDETILDDSEFRLERLGLPYDPQAFDAWCARERAVALPGAGAFLRRVRALGGVIALVTNRSQSICEHTRTNLDREGLPFDQVLCKEGTDDKNPRFAALASGVPPSTLPPFTILMWLGDNIEDFPKLRQSELRNARDEAFRRFGADFFVLPNPVYGSWTQNPLH